MRDLPFLYDDQILTSGNASFQPGDVYAWRGGSGRKEWAFVKYVELDNGGCSRGEALVTNYATLSLTQERNTHPQRP